jgi:hypothetical protein
MYFQSFGSYISQFRCDLLASSNWDFIVGNLYYGNERVTSLYGPFGTDQELVFDLSRYNGLWAIVTS